MSATTSEQTGIEWMATMVASLADNKAALGRRYSDWAVSAPTLESAVAAAAMAQDELGHARSTYPVLKALGVEGEEDHGFGGERRMALLDDEFDDWLDFIAANLVVDGMLATFVAACDGSAVPQMAQRAKKILQEEGSHRVHGEAWARRLCRDSTTGSQLAERIEADWQEASHWLGPNDDEGAEAALAAGMVKLDVAGQREQVRSWLTDLFEEAGVELDLADPIRWDDWAEDARRIER